MKKQTIIPYAVVATLAFGTTANSVAAIEADEANSHYPGVVDWSETEWNNYLEENYGTNLDDYDSPEELEAVLGTPVDLDALGSGESGDQNILDIMDRYDLNSEELAAFLNEYEDRENIYFVGDLEGALVQDGFQVADGTDEEEPGTDDAETQQEGDLPFDSDMLEEAYLNPLNWSQEEFSDYVSNNFGMELEEFESFDQLFSTVGPVLTEQNLSEALIENDLTSEEAEELLNEEGESIYDYDFLYELEEALGQYAPEGGETDGTDASDDTESTDDSEAGDGTGSTDDTEAGDGTGSTDDTEAGDGTGTGEELPDTATSTILSMWIGLGVVLAGGFLLIRRRPQGEK